MAADGVKGVPVPTSQFVADESLVSEHEMSYILGRLKGSASTGGQPTGSHGSALISVQAEPGGQTLSQTDQNTVTAGTDLGFKVTIEDSGDSQEVGIKITLTIQQTPAIVKTLSIQVINPGEQKSVTFTEPRRGQVRAHRAVVGQCRRRAGRDEPEQQPRHLLGHLLARLVSLAGMSVTATEAMVVAIAGVAVGAIGLGLAWWSSIRVKRVRDAQRSLLGGGRRDLVDFAVSLQARIDDLHRAVDEVAAGLGRVDRRIDGVVANTRDRPLRRVRGHRRPSVGVARAARLGAVGPRS